MIILGFLLLLVLSTYGVWRLSARSPGRRDGWTVILRVAGLIATLRIGAIWLGIFGLQRSDWVQVPAYFLLMAGWPDIYIVRAARAEPLRWGLLASLVVAATSPAWAAAFLWLAKRLHNESATRSDNR
jgi:hypothetical protein